MIPSGYGLILEGEVGLTSHIADVVRKAAVDEASPFVRAKSFPMY
jgi:hypothetical protein